jgi:hypothetical protein
MFVTQSSDSLTTFLSSGPSYVQDLQFAPLIETLYSST